MTFKTTTLSAILFFVYLNSMAQFPTNTNYQNIVANQPTLPNLNEHWIDTTLPDDMAITRITEFVAAWNWYPIHEYAKVQPWNANATVYKFYTVAMYDAQTHIKIRDIPGGNLYPTYWSNTNPEILYGFQQGGQIRTYNINTELITTLDEIQGYEYLMLGPGEGNIDKNDHFVAFTAKDGTNLDVITYDLQNTQIVHTETFAGAWGNGDADSPNYVDWVSVSQSGNYIGIMWNHNTTSQANPFDGHYGVEIYDAQTMQFLRRIATYGNHGDFGYAADGDEVFVQFWGETGTVNMFYLDRMERVVLSTNSDFNVEGHISCRNLNRPGWAYISQDTPQNSGVIVAMKLDNSGTIEYFGHHFSDSATYNESPMPCPNPNGDTVLFKSDWGNTNDTTEIYVFEATKLSNLNVSEIQNNTTYQINNPVKNNLNITSEKIINNIILTNILGQIIKKKENINLSEITIHTAALKKGIYFLTINNSYTKKIIITK